MLRSGIAAAALAFSSLAGAQTPPEEPMQRSVTTVLVGDNPTITITTSCDLDVKPSPSGKITIDERYPEANGHASLVTRQGNDVTYLQGDKITARDGTVTLVAADDATAETTRAQALLDGATVEEAKAGSPGCKLEVKVPSDAFLDVELLGRAVMSAPDVVLRYPIVRLRDDSIASLPRTDSPLVSVSGAGVAYVGVASGAVSAVVRDSGSLSVSGNPTRAFVDVYQHGYAQICGKAPIGLEMGVYDEGEIRYTAPDTTKITTGARSNGAIVREKFCGLQ